MKKAIWAYLPILLFLAFAACGQRAANAQSTSIASTFDTTFLGTINNRLKIEMDLYRKGDRLIGSYFYEKTREETGTVTELGLDGQIRQDGTFVIAEDDRGTPTGTFKGIFRIEMVNGEPIMRMIGTWSKAGDKKELPFSATEWHFDLGSGLKLKSITKTEYDAKSKWRTTATYPQLEGDSSAAGFNQVVNAIVKKEVGEFTGDSKDAKPAEENKDQDKDQDTNATRDSTDEINYGITAANASLISIDFTHLSDDAGAIHPNSSTIVLNYDLKAGKVLALADLFKPDADYLKFLSDYCIGSLTKRRLLSDEEWLQRGAGPKAENYKNWNLHPTGLLITFDPYQVAAHAEGTVEVFIPYTKLKEIINSAGPVRSLLK